MMDTWPPKLKLISVLTTTHLFLLRSKEEAWPDEKPEETAREVQAILAHIFDPNKHPLPEYWSIQFAPTGPVQEIAMANGWSETYLKLAAEYDGLEYLIRNGQKSPEGAG